MQPIANPKEARLSPSHHFGATSNTFSPMSEAAAADAAPSPALLLWIIRHGPAHLLDIVNRFIRQLHQTLLPQLWKHLRQLPAVSLAPVWLAAKHSLVSLIHAWVSEICHKIAAAWLQLYSRLKHYLEQSHSRQEPPCQADTKAEPVTQQQGTESWQDRQATDYCCPHRCWMRQSKASRLLLGSFLDTQQSSYLFTLYLQQHLTLAESSDLALCTIWTNLSLCAGCNF